MNTIPYRSKPADISYIILYRPKISSVQVSFSKNGLNRTEQVGSVRYRPEPSNTRRFGLVRCSRVLVRLDFLFFFSLDGFFFQPLDGIFFEFFYCRYGMVQYYTVPTKNRYGPRYRFLKSCSM